VPYLAPSLSNEAEVTAEPSMLEASQGLARLSAWADVEAGISTLPVRAGLAPKAASLPDVEALYDIQPGWFAQSHAIAAAGANDPTNTPFQRGVFTVLDGLALPLVFAEETVRAAGNAPAQAGVSAQWAARASLESNSDDSLTDISNSLYTGGNALLGLAGGAGFAESVTADTVLSASIKSPFSGLSRPASGPTVGVLDPTTIPETSSDGPVLTWKASSVSEEVSHDVALPEISDSVPNTGNPNIVYRALNADDAAALDAGGGLSAKAPNGTWTAAEHIANAGPGTGGAAANSPWISTTRSLEVAQGYEGGNGIVAIDLSKVDSAYVELWKQGPPTMVGGSQSIPYWRSLYAQEVTVNQAIPRNAIIEWAKTP
jgi:hypothetical protein